MKQTSAAADPRCTKCSVPGAQRICITATGRGPEFCPTLRLPEALREARRLLRDPQTLEFARQATVQEAEVLNRAHTDFNILIGLCVGHDSLFFKHAEAYTTVLAAKDRVLGHNPLAAVYTLGSYSEWLLSPGLGEER